MRFRVKTKKSKLKEGSIKNSKQSKEQGQRRNKKIFKNTMKSISKGKIKLKMWKQF